MQAALYHRNGSARDVLLVEDIDRPEPGPGQVRVRVALSGLNPTDVKTREGATARPIDGFQVPHQDGSGVIDAVGTGVDAARVGERVWVWFAAFGNRYGTAAEYCVVPADRAVPLPGNVSDVLGACLGVPALTAHRCLFADGRLNGRTVVVAGGAGAVGHYAIQLAKQAGAKVITTVSGPEKAEQAAAAGADHVVNYREAGAADQVRAYADDRPVDRIVEVALGANLELDLAVSGPRTVISCYAAAGDVSLPVRALMSANVTLRFVLLYGVPAPDLAESVAEVNAVAGAGALTPLPEHRHPLADVAAAHEAVEQGAVGKVLLDLADQSGA
ncbi:NADPH:quinone reductase [Streptomyces montanisoli]|uniref:NADPH:quinone reductase n=1 Tax=Streptomyces montanisoli TaxID=2798581 RepID=A0A940RUQ0_9ACTN|nr:NADPH:quinone reductase [Streptomyces montanisoli]MBP0457450.1 NADPH:quinone reductase [Streptomyces montanisoli]